MEKTCFSFPPPQSLAAERNKISFAYRIRFLKRDLVETSGLLLGVNKCEFLE